jgi:hypothetical protein
MTRTTVFGGAYFSYAPTGGASTITPSVTLARTTGIAPLYVHFDATATTSTETTLPFHELRYVWNFGDGSAGSWGKGAALGSRNTDEGPVAGHIYETGGTFSPYVDIYDGVSVSRHYTDTVTVTAADDATEFATTKTVVVNNIGDADFTGAPTGATQQNTDSLTTALGYLTGSVKRILFKRGGDWSATAFVAKNLAGPLLIGSYGSGALPKWTLDAAFADTPVLYLGNNAFVAGDLRIMDIEIDGNAVADPKAISCFYAFGTYDQMTFLRITNRGFTLRCNFSEALLNIYSRTVSGQRIWDQLAIVDCTSLDPPNRAGGGVSTNIPYGDAFSAERYFYAGNDVDLEGDGTISQQATHCLRVLYSYKGIIAHNTLANPGALTGRLMVKAHGPIWVESAGGANDWLPGYLDGTTSLLIHPTAAGVGDVPQVSADQGGGQGYTRYLLIRDNKLVQDSFNATAWFMDLGSQDIFNHSRNKDQIVEANWGVATGGYAYMLVCQSEQTTFRNNVMNCSGAAGASGKGLAYITTNAATTGWTCADTWIYNNSSYHSDGNSGAAEYLISAPGGNAPTGTIIKNNLKYAPSDATATMIDDSGTGTVASNNTGDVGGITTTPTFAATPPVALADWRASGYGKDAGASVPVLGDIFGNLRPLGAGPDIGAGEQ